ncbi:uncharacterized protein [Drosophila takahashii]|uniref:uncharacterized protein isoform X2 n=1 Tax=Drosophila takahashii TaxID=29030 RepID=UPI0038992C18
MLIKENFNDGEEKDESKDETAVDRAQTSALINENVSDEEKYGSKDETAVVRAQTPVFSFQLWILKITALLHFLMI